MNIYHTHLKKKKKNLQDKVTLESYLFQFFLGQCQIANLAIKDIWKKKKLKSYGLTPPCARAMAVTVSVDHIYETNNFLLSNTQNKFLFNMKQEPSKITMKEVLNSEINSSTKTPLTLP